MDARRKMSDGSTNVASITTCTRKFIHNAHTEPLRERIFRVEQVLERVLLFYINRLGERLFTRIV